MGTDAGRVYMDMGSGTGVERRAQAPVAHGRTGPLVNPNPNPKRTTAVRAHSALRFSRIWGRRPDVGRGGVYGYGDS